MLSSVRPPRVYEQIVAQIERRIYEGRLRHGDKLPPERQLVRDFHASRVAVREALRALEHRGLVEVRQGSAGGYFVREVDERPLVRDLSTLLRLGRVALPHLIEARLLLEPEMARLAARRATPADLDALAAVLEERGAAGPGRRDRDVRFHCLIAEAARNPVHAVMTRALIELETGVVVPAANLSDADETQIAAGHRGILDAIVARQPEAAAAAMQDHILDVEQRRGHVAHAHAC